MTERSSVPSWAQPATERATERQLTFINSLLEERELARLSYEQQTFLALDNLHLVLSKGKASKVIEALLALPKKKLSVADIRQIEVPAGRYAVDNNEGELRFYQVWRAKDNPAIVRVYVLHGPDQSALPRPAATAIMVKIAVNPREAAIRYGLEIGSCSNCGRRLTNRISRELGIGPVCGGRMFGDEFKPMVVAKRADIVLRGEDPDEELE